MSLSTIIDTLHTEMDTLFSATKTEIPNPYSLPDNPVILLKDGYGLQINDEVDSEIDTLKDDNASREFTFLLTKEVFRLENDVTILRNNSKTILADQRSFKDRLMDFDQLGIDDTIQKVNILTVSGIDFLVAGKFNFLTCNIIFTIDYFTEI